MGPLVPHAAQSSPFTAVYRLLRAGFVTPLEAVKGLVMSLLRTGNLASGDVRLNHGHSSHFHLGELDESGVLQKRG